MSLRDRETEEEQMVTLIKQVTQDFLKGFLPPNQTAVPSTSVRLAKGRLEPEARVEEGSDVSGLDSSGEGDEPIFDFSLVGHFVRAAHQALDLQEPIAEDPKPRVFFKRSRKSTPSLS